VSILVVLYKDSMPCANVHFLTYGYTSIIVLIVKLYVFQLCSQVYVCYHLSIVFYYDYHMGNEISG